MKLAALHLSKHQGFVYQQLYEAIRDDILSQQIQNGDQLPSLRCASTQLQISRTSVERAYEQLLSEGYLMASPKRGYFVKVTPLDIKRRQQILMPPKQDVESARYDFRSKRVDAQHFDHKVWKKYIKDILDQKDALYTYGDVAGEWELRKALQQYAYANRGVIGELSQIIVGASFQTLLSLVCGMLKQGATIGMEKGSFLQAQQIFRDYRLPIVWIDCTSNEVMLKQLVDDQVSFFYCHSASFGPDKESVSSKQRDALLYWANQYHGWILEDDHNGELNIGTHLQSAMQGYDHHQRTVYFGSFSKLLLPSLRIAYLVLPPYFTDKFQARAHAYNATASKMEQLVLARYISDGHLEKHIRRLRRRYQEKQEKMEVYLKQYLMAIPYRLNRAGLCYHLYPDVSKLDLIVSRCKEADIIVQRDEDSLMLSFAGIHDEVMKDAIILLNNQIQKVCIE